MTVEELAAKLDISPKALEARRRKFRMEHGEEAEAKLLRWLETTEREMRDRVRIPARQNGLLHPPQYVGDMAGAIDDPGESVPPDVQDAFCVDARTRRALEQERDQQQQAAQLRSFNEAMRRKIRKGENIAPHLTRALQQEDAA